MWRRSFKTSDPDKAMYQDAANLIDDATANVRTRRLQASTAPPLRIDGIDGAITWPLAPTHAAALAALDIPNGTLFPTSFAFVQPTAWRKIVQNELHREAASAITEADLVLSHLVIDAVGTGAALVPTNMPVDAFGYMALHLPSAYDGGEMTFSYRYSIETWTPDKADVEIAATFRDLVPTSAPITRGVRLALVFRLVMIHDDDDVPAPCNQTEAVAAFQRVAELPLHTHHVISCNPDEDASIDHIWTFETLGSYEAGLVDALMTTELYDVAIVTFAKESDKEVIYEKALRRSSDDDDRVDAFLFNDALIDHHMFEGPPFALVFWLKRYRASILGLDVVLPLVAKAIVNHNVDQPCLGLPTIRDVLHGALGVCRRQTLGPAIDSQTPSRLITLCELVLALEDVELAIIFLRDASFVSCDRPITTVAACIHACLERYGWDPLAPAMLGLISRWYRPLRPHAPCWHSIDVDCMPRLLASLAGITKDAVCLPLNQPLVCELIKRCYHHALDQHRFLPESKCEHEVLRRFATHVILLDWYLDEGAPNAAGGNYLSTFLPPSMILAVDTYVYDHLPGTSTLLSIRAQSMASRLLLYVPEALVFAMKSQPTISIDLYLRVIERALETFNGDSVRYEMLGATIFSSIVNLLDRAGRCDVARFEAVWRLFYPASVAGTRQLLHQRTLQDEVRACIASLLVAIAPTLSSMKVWRRSGYNDCYTSWEQLGLMAVEVLAIVDPTRMPTLLQKWLEAMDRETAHEEKSSFNRVVQAQELYFPLAQLLANTVPQHVDEIHGIAQRCLDVFGAARSRIPLLPIISDYILDNSSLDATHCYLCKILADFLNDGTRFSLRSLHVPALCDAAQGSIEINRHRLKLRCKARTSYYDVIKVPLKGGAGVGQLYELGVTQRQDTEDRARVAVLGTIVADDQRRPAPDGEAPHQHCVKRQRRSFSYR